LENGRVFRGSPENLSEVYGMPERGRVWKACPGAGLEDVGKKIAMTKNKVTKAVFPVAGLGTRFLPATKSIPKEIMTLVDRPLIQYAIDEARAAGIEEFIFVT
jgi:hypothetical protein